jgi:nucleoside-diphosphate-sugar epimerase
LDLITGATGLLGSHIAERLVQEGRRVRALVRPGSNLRFLEELGVELVTGDLSDPASLRKAVEGVDVVFHSAAKVGDWGPWREFQLHTIDGTRRLVEACAGTRLQRFVHISSISVYGHPKPKPGGITEHDPFATRFWWWDYYPRAKIAAEQIVWDAHRSIGLPVTVIRPGWIYGPRDRTSLSRLATALSNGSVWILGDGNNLLNTIYVTNVVDACLLAAEKTNALGRAYNVCHDGPITQREFIRLFATALGVRPPTWRMPMWLALYGGFWGEAFGRLFGIRQPPPVTRYAVWLMGRKTAYSTERARKELDWQPRVGYEEGIQRTVEWYQQPGDRPPAR